MTRKFLAALLLAAVPAGHAMAGSIDAAERAVLASSQAGMAEGYAAYVGNRWQPITIHLDTTPVATSLPAGLAGPRRLSSPSALYNWTLAHAAADTGTAGSPFAYGWGNGRRGFSADDDSRDFVIPAWHGHGHGPGHWHGGGDDDGGGVPAVPLPASLPLLLSALALLGFALRGAARD